jgi:hypothetical protein
MVPFPALIPSIAFFCNLHLMILEIRVRPDRHLQTIIHNGDKLNIDNPCEVKMSSWTFLQKKGYGIFTLRPSMFLTIEAPLSVSYMS